MGRGQRVREDGPVDAAVADGERGVPATVGDEPVDRRNHPVEELADRLPAEEPRVVRDHPAERVHELALECVGGDLREAAALDLPQLRPRLGLDSGRDDPAVSSVRGSPLVTTRSRSMVRNASATACACATPSSLSGTSVGFTGDPSEQEVRHLRVAHEVQATATHGLRRIARWTSSRPRLTPMA